MAVNIGARCLAEGAALFETADDADQQVGRPGGQADLRAHRERADRHQRARAAGPPQGHERAALDRRLRHRLLVARVPAEAAGGGDQGRPLVRDDAVHRARRRRDRALDRRPGPQPRRDRRGRRAWRTRPRWMRSSSTAATPPRASTSAARCPATRPRAGSRAPSSGSSAPWSPRALPAAPWLHEGLTLRHFGHTAPMGEERPGAGLRVGLFITCINDTLFPRTGIATVEVLERMGCEVVFPEEQTCCGQMHANSGYREQALPLVRRFARAFGEAGVDAVVCPSGSCAAMVRDQYPRLAPDTAELAAQTFELSEFLVNELGVEDVGATYPHRVTYHPTCHSLRLLKVGDAPLKLLRNVRGLDLVELPDGRPVLRLRRHVRGQERRHVGGHAHRQDAQRARHRRRGLRGGRQLVPDAHRRRALAPARGRARPCTWPRSWRRPNELGGLPRGRRARAGRQPAAAQPAQGHLDHPRQARGRGGRAGRLGAAARRGRADQGARGRPPGRAPGAARAVRDRRRRHGALGPRRRRGQPDRGRPDRARRAATRWSRSSR